MIAVSHYVKHSKDSGDQLFSMSAEDRTQHN